LRVGKESEKPKGRGGLKEKAQALGVGYVEKQRG